MAGLERKLNDRSHLRAQVNRPIGRGRRSEIRRAPDSITRAQYAARKGWTVDDRFVFVDDGISGAEFANRPGFLRLMNALKPRAPFQVLIMSEESRLGREAIETAYALKQLVRRAFGCSSTSRTANGRSTPPPTRSCCRLTAFADELEREKARQRTYDAMLRKAKAGHVTGGYVFRLRNIEIVGATASARTSSARSNRPKPTSSGGSSGCRRRARA